MSRLLKGLRQLIKLMLQDEYCVLQLDLDPFRAEYQCLRQIGV